VRWNFFHPATALDLMTIKSEACVYQGIATDPNITKTEIVAIIDCSRSAGCSNKTVSTHFASINDRNLSVAQYLGSVASRNPDSLCLIQPQGASVTYGALWKQISETRTALTGLGITRRSRVALMLPPHESNIVTLLSAMSCAPCVVLNPEIPRSELGSNLARVKASVLMLPASGNAEVAGVASAAGMQVVRVRETSGTPFSIELHADPDIETSGRAANDTGVYEPPAIDDDAVLLFTSGTSAAPKLVALTHRQLLISASNIASALELRSDDRQLGLMPLHHIHGLSTALSSLLSGGSIVCTRGFIEDAFPRCLHELGVTWYSASPSIHRQIINRMSATRDGSSARSRLRFVRSASEKMPLELLATIEARLGVPVIEAYGMTEASPQISSNGLDPRDRRAGSAGRAAGPDIRIIGVSGINLPSGAVGEIAIKGDNVITRYADSDIDTRHAFIDGWLRTGDEGYLDADGFLFITGRLDDVINRGGVKVSPARVEQVLNNHPVVAESAAFGVPDNQLGQEVAAAVVLARGGAPGYCDTARYLEYQKTMGELQRDLAGRLSRSELPKSFYIVERPPTGPGGKRRRAVPEKFQALIVPAPVPDPATEPAVTPTLAESFLLDVYKDVLNAESLTLTDNFIDLGGDSLATMQLIARINEAFEVNLPSSAVFDNPTIAGLARFIGSHLADAAVGDKRDTGRSGRRDSRAEATGDAGPDQGYALSDVQKQIWFMHRNNVGAAYHVSASLYLSGSLSVAALEKALDEIVARHDSLRAGIREQNGRPEQFVRDAAGCELEVSDLETLPRERRKAALRELEQSTHDTPFDLARDRLVRFHLVRIDDGQHVLLITLHHIFTDGWSVNILYRELGAFY